MKDEQFKTLFDEAKNSLDITWEDADLDKKLGGILKRGMAYLNRKAGALLDFTEEGQPKALLFDYARYARANALDEFEGNYSHELLDLHLQYWVEGAKADDSSEDAG